MKLLLFLGTFVVISQYVVCMKQYYIDTQCNQTVYASFYEQILVQLSLYTPNKQCQLTFYTDSTDQFMVYIRSMNIPGMTGICSNNWLEVHDGSSRQSSNIFYYNRMCGYMFQSGVYRTTRGLLTFYFQSDFSTPYSSVDVVVTPYHSGFCNAGDYSCSNGLCIDDSLTCSGDNPCGDYSDCDYDTINVGGIAGGVVGGIVFIICVTFIIIICRRRRRMIMRDPMVVKTSMATGVPPPPGYNKPNYGSAQPAGALYP